MLENIHELRSFQPITAFRQLMWQWYHFDEIIQYRIPTINNNVIIKRIVSKIFSDVDNKKLIGCWRNEPALWDVRSSEYTNADVIAIASNSLITSNTTVMLLWCRKHATTLVNS